MTDRPDLAELLRRRALTEDAARPDAVARRHAAGGRTARENIADLVDADSFVEYGRFAIAAQRSRRDLDDLIARTPADGLIAGTAQINGHPCAVLSYDYTVLAGTQGVFGHRKKDRLFELIERMRLPTVFFAEGGGGRPGDTDYPTVSSLEMRAFKLWAALSGVVPADRDREGALLRRQRGDRRLLGSHRRHRRHLDRHGWPGDDRGGRPGRCRARRRRADLGAITQRCRRRRRRRRGRGRRGHQASHRVLPGQHTARPGRRSNLFAHSHSRAGPARLPDRADHRDPRRRRLGHLPAAEVRLRDGHRAGPDRRPPGRRHRQQHDGHGRRDHRRRPPTRRRASCNCATPSDCPSSRSSTAPATWSARPPKPRRWSGAPRGCWSPAPRFGCRWWR